MNLWVVLITYIFSAGLIAGCDSDLQVQTQSSALPEGEQQTDTASTVSPKLASSDCIDPDLQQIPTTVTLTLCNGETAIGLLDLSELKSENILTGKTVGGVTGTLDLSNLTPNNILSGVTIAGVAGAVIPAPVNCSTDGETACVATTSYRAADMMRVVAGNVKASVTIAGVTGSYSGSNTACVSDGETGCLTGGGFVAADVNNLLAANIRNGIVVGGVTGSYPSLPTPLAGASAVADLVSMAANTAAGTYEFFDSTGARYTGTISDAGSVTATVANQQFNTSLYRQFTVNGDADLVAANIKTGIDIFGVAGTLTPAPNNCATDGETACVTTGTFKAANTAGFAAGDVKSGKTVAGIAGSLANCAADGSVGCVTTANFKAADMNNVTAANVKAGVLIAGVTGDFPSATNPLGGASATADLDNTNFLTQIKSAATFEYWNSAGVHFTGSGDADLAASNVKLGVDIFGVVGTVTPSAANCSSNGEVGCVTTPSYQAADLSNLSAGNIKNGITVAGVAGTYPSLATPLAGSSVTADLVSLAATTAAGSYEFFDSTGTRYTGTISDAGTITPGTSNQTFNNSVYRGFSVNGDADLVSSNILSSINIFGVAGSVTAAPADCSANGQTACVTTSTFKAADLTNLLAGNVKNGVSLAGVTGNYPSATSPLAGSDATTDLPAFAGVAGGSTYEWFKSDGSRLTGSVEADANVTPSTATQTLNAGLYRSVVVSGDPDLVANNIKNAVNIFGVVGNVVPSAANCSSDGETGCVTTASFKAADMTNVIAGNIKAAVTIAGVVGSLSGTPANCSSNAEVGCVTTTTYKAADLTNLIAGNIKNGVTVAGTAGTYPSVATPLVGATGTADLVSMAASTAAGSYEFFDSTGTRYTGSITDAGTVTPGTSNQTFGTSLYRTFTVSGDADLVATNIKNTIDIFGVVGSVTPSPANCSADGVTGCVTTSTYKSANTSAYAAGDIKSGKTIAGVAGTLADCSTDGTVGCVTTASYKSANMTNVTAANVKAGIVIAGVTGDYPSATNPLGGATATADLDSSTFNTQVKSATAFEYWDSAGNRYAGAGDADIVAGNIKTAIDIFGTTGTVTPSPANCSSNGATGCVTTATYVSADLTNLSAGNIKNGVTIAGTAGTYPSAGTPLSGATATTDLVSMAASTAAGSYEFFDSAGTRYTGSITDAGTVTPGTSNQTFSTSLYRTFTVAGDADLVATNIKNSVDIFGVVGSVTPSPAACVADGVTGCVTTSTYKSANTSAYAAGDIKSGKTIAGVAGTLADCAADGGVGCVTTASYKSANMTNVTAANVKSGVVIAGVTGDYPSATNPLTGFTATADLDSSTFNSKVKSATAFEYWDSAGNRYSGAGDADIVAGNIKTAIDIFGTTGTVTPTPANCAANGVTGCVTTATYQSADLTNLSAGNIKNGVTIAGTAGTYPSAGTPLSGATATTDLVSMAASTAAGSYEFFDSAGTRYTGSITDAGTVTPGTSNQTFSTSLYRTFTVAGDANLVAAKIKNGTALFGVTGNYPSTTSPLASNTATADLESATFNAKVKSATAFEWFDSTGAAYTATGDTDIAAANIKSGVDIFGTAGTYVGASNCTTDGQTGCVTTSTYKAADTGAFTAWDIRKGKTVAGVAGNIVFYKNMRGTYDNTTAPAISGTDMFDTVDDYNAAGAFPSTAPSGWDQATGANWTMDPTNDNGVGSGTASDNLCNGTEACVFIDQITGLYWTKDQGTANWSGAITLCDNSTYGGYSNWRLPTHKELMQAHIDGVWSLKATNKLSYQPADYWSATTLALSTADAWTFGPDGTLHNAYDGKVTSQRVTCVRP